MICKFVTGRVRKNRKDAPVTNVDLIVISLRHGENFCYKNYKREGEKENRWKKEGGRKKEEMEMTR